MGSCKASFQEQFPRISGCQKLSRCRYRGNRFSVRDFLNLQKHLSVLLAVLSFHCLGLDADIGGTS